MQAAFSYLCAAHWAWARVSCHDPVCALPAVQMPTTCCEGTATKTVLCKGLSACNVTICCSDDSWTTCTRLCTHLHRQRWPQGARVTACGSSTCAITPRQTTGFSVIYADNIDSVPQPRDLCRRVVTVPRRSVPSPQNPQQAHLQAVPAHDAQRRLRLVWRRRCRRR